MGHNVLLSQIRANRRGLRLRGLTAADILALEAVAAVAPTGARRLSVAALGRLIGVSRAAALNRVRRLEAAGALIRMKSLHRKRAGVLMLNVRGVLAWLETAVKGRLSGSNRLFSLWKRKTVNHLLTDNRTFQEKGLEAGEVGIPDRQTALAALRACYVPVHLRRSA